VAVVGDAAAGAGVTFEALNHAGHGHANLLVVLNDNQWSIARTVGALGRYLNRIRTLPAYREGKKDLLDALALVPLVGGPLQRWASNVKEAVANYMSPGHLFRELGWTYFGPENGHDEPRLETLLRDLHRVKGPVLLHVVTEKGRGAPVPGTDAAHAVSPPKAAKVPPPVPATVAGGSGGGAAPPPSISWSAAFGRTAARLMDADPRVVAITAAMPDGTGLAPVAARFPERVIDVGICEQHGVALAGGMAEMGMKPIAAIYSTFLQRGYDQVWQEVVVQGLPVVFALDRAGIVGGDGITHQGLYDVAYLRTFPGVCLMAPADPPELDAMLRHALDAVRGPAAVRFPRGSAPDASLPGNDAANPAERLRTGKGVLLRPGRDLALLAYGSMVAPALEAAELLAAEGVEAAVWNARFARPLDTLAVERFAAKFPLLFTLEEHSVNGGFGSAVLEHLATLPAPTTALVRVLGVPDRLVPHGDPQDWFQRFGLTPRAIAERARRELAALAPRQA
jgi:1-deoxy-D-xylulose-5-phosphate synthase